MKRLQSKRDDEERIRPDELLRVTQTEASGNDDWLRRKAKRKRSSSLPKGISWAVAALAIIFIGGFITTYIIAKKHVAKVISSNVGTLQAGVADLQNFDALGAKQQFLSLNASTSFEGVMGTLLSLFKSSGSTVNAFKDFSVQLVNLSQDLANVEEDIFNATAKNGSNNLVADLTALKISLAAIDSDTNQLSSVAGYWNNGSVLASSDALSLKTDIESAENFLNEFVPWLSASAPHHILVLLQNSSELRPGGGFLGSYADVTISSGTITNIAVHDIADVDTAFTANIIPPKPLQLEGPRFRPADGNWFFDYPTSASKTIALFERSALYAGSATTTPVAFDGVIALTPNVIADLLRVTGPITISGGTGTQNQSTTFTADNLSVQIQTIVQAGQAQNATYPKDVLGKLSQSLLQTMASSTADQRAQLLSMVLEWVADKDVMGYFNDSVFQNFATAHGAAGNVYQLPQNFNGDYLALASADINSDKSELYIDEKVNFTAGINSDGTVSDHLTIVRQHNGDSSPYWWYQTTNQDYMQIFVPDGTTLQNESGGLIKNVPAPLNYAQKGYSTDPLIGALESSTITLFGYPALTSHKEDGKEVFGVWMRTYKGSSSTVTFDYSHHLYSAPFDGEQYQFVFDKQSGAAAHYTFEIDAPIGYMFEENGLPTYEYASSSVPGRLIVNLTLKKN